MVEWTLIELPYIYWYYLAFLLLPYILVLPGILTAAIYTGITGHSYCCHIYWYILLGILTASRYYYSDYKQGMIN